MFLCASCYPEHRLSSVNMKTMILLLFLAAVAVYAETEMEYHPQAIMHYLEMEDREMAKKVRSIVKLEDPQPLRPSFRPTGRLPSGFPTGLPPKIVSTDPVIANLITDYRSVTFGFTTNLIKHAHLLERFFGLIQRNNL